MTTHLIPYEVASTSGKGMLAISERDRAEVNIVEVSTSGSDSALGSSELRPKASFDAAVIAADAMTGKSTVVCRDNSVLTNSLTNLLLFGDVSLFMPFAELNGGLQIAGVAHEGTVISIGNFASGALTINASATGTVYLNICTAHGAFTMPSIPSGLTVIGLVDGSPVGYGMVPAEDIPELFNTVFLAYDGSDSFNGSNFHQSVASFSRAMELARGKPSSDHKTILAFEARNYGDLINNDTIGNVPNLIVDARSAIFEDVDLTEHSTALDCRRIIGNVTIGNQSSIDVYSINHNSTQTVSFSTDEVHQTTRLKAKLLNSTTFLSFDDAPSGSHFHVEIDRYEADRAACVATIPTGVTVTGFIETPLPDPAVESRLSALEERIQTDITASTGPTATKLILGANDHNVLASSGWRDDLHVDDIFHFQFNGSRTSSKLKGTLTLNKAVRDVSIPSQYYYFITGGALQPTEDGTNIATSDVRDYLGTSSNMFETQTTFNEALTNNALNHSLTVTTETTFSPLTAGQQTHNFNLVFNFPDFDLDVVSFIGDIVIHTNSGDKQSLWNGKTRVRFDRVSAGSGRYTMTLGTDSAFDASPLLVSDLFNVQEWDLNLNGNGYPNEEDVNGQVEMLIPYIPNAKQIIDIVFHGVAITES